MSDQEDLIVPELGESIREAVISRWHKRIGDAVKLDEPVVDLETDKITVQLPAPADGVLRSQLAGIGATVVVGSVIGQIDTRRTTAVPQQPGTKLADGTSGTEVAGDPGRAAGQPGRDPGRAEMRGPGDGPGDLDADSMRRLSPAQRRAVRMGEPLPGFVPAPASAPASAPAPAPAPASAPAVPARPGPASPAPAPRLPAGLAAPDEEAVAMSPLRKRIAERLVKVQKETASLTTFNEVDMSAIMALRDDHKDEFLAVHGVKLGFMAFFVKACVAACERFPGLHAEVRDNQIVYKHRYHFGVAVSTDRGLVVPVLRDVDRMNLAEIEQGIVELASRARDGKLALDDLTGGTFTITNGGIFGSMLSTPILNYPQTGILGMHNIVKRPVAIGDAVAVRPIMYVALTYDHRVVDGREAVQFLVTVKQCLEKPSRLLLEL